MARARSVEGLVVVKVFAIHDPSLPLAAHKTKVEEIKAKLSSAVNCLPFQRAVVSFLNKYQKSFNHRFVKLKVSDSN